jgi:cell division inhibitor SulA
LLAPNNMVSIYYRLLLNSLLDELSSHTASHKGRGKGLDLMGRPATLCSSSTSQTPDLKIHSFLYTEHF